MSRAAAAKDTSGPKPARMTMRSQMARNRWYGIKSYIGSSLWLIPPGPSQRRQWGEDVLRTLVTPGSVVRPFRAKAGDGMPHLASAKSCPPSAALTIGAG